jgi:hypothetical protein
MKMLSQLRDHSLSNEHSILSESIGEIIRITFCCGGQIRSRRVVTRSRSCPTGKYPSWKMGRMVQWESRNELYAFRLLDCDPKVTTFHEQPCEIVYRQNGVERRHYPDVYVETTGSKELWEIKPSSKASQDVIAARSTLLRDGLKQYGFIYRVVLDCDLAKQPRLQNVDILLRFGRRPLAEYERERVRQYLRRLGSVCWSDVCQGVYGPKGREIVCRLVLEGALAFDVDCPLSPDTPFTYSQRGI